MTKRRALAILASVVVAAAAPAVLVAPSPASADTTKIYDGNGPGTAHIGVIGDSVMSGIRWTNSYAPLSRVQLHVRRRVLPSHDRRVVPRPRGLRAREPHHHPAAAGRPVGQRAGDDHRLQRPRHRSSPTSVDAIMAEAIAAGHRPGDVADDAHGRRHATCRPATSRTATRSATTTASCCRRRSSTAGALQIADWATYSAGTALVGGLRRRAPQRARRQPGGRLHRRGRGPGARRRHDHAAATRPGPATGGSTSAAATAAPGWLRSRAPDAPPGAVRDGGADGVFGRLHGAGRDRVPAPLRPARDRHRRLRHRHAPGRAHRRRCRRTAPVRPCGPMSAGRAGCRRRVDPGRCCAGIFLCGGPTGSSTAPPGSP